MFENYGETVAFFFFRKQLGIRQNSQEEVNNDHTPNVVDAGK